MRPLPNAPSLQTLCPVIAVAHGNETDQGSRQHPLIVAFLLALRDNSAQHSRRQSLGQRRGHRGQPKRVDCQSVAKLLHIAPLQPNPSLARRGHSGVGVKVRVRGCTESDNLFPLCFAREQKQLHTLFLAGQATQLFPKIAPKRLLRIIKTPVRVTPRNGFVEFRIFSGTRRKIHTGHQLIWRPVRHRTELTGNQVQRRRIAVGWCGQQQILQRTTHTDMFFPQIGIKCPHIPLPVDIQLDKGVAGFEPPGLRIVRAGCEQRGSHQL